MSQEVLLSVSDALDRLLAVFQPFLVEKLLLSACSRRVLAEDILADADLPPFPDPTMDGDEYGARLTGSQDSDMQRSLLAANALVLPAGVKEVNAEGILEAWILNTISV
jgi:molybdopterin biosynthesis enzyme